MNKFYRTKPKTQVQLPKQSILSKQLSGRTFFFSMSFILIAGLLLVAGIHFIINKQVSIKQALQQGPVTREPINLSLNLSNPDDNLLLSNANLLVQGQTSPHALIIISTDTDDTVIDDTGQGDFSATIKLSSGLNHLTIAAFDGFGNSKREDRTVFYSAEKL